MNDLDNLLQRMSIHAQVPNIQPQQIQPSTSPQFYPQQANPSPVFYSSTATYTYPSPINTSMQQVPNREQETASTLLQLAQSPTNDRQSWNLSPNNGAAFGNYQNAGGFHNNNAINNGNWNASIGSQPLSIATNVNYNSNDFAGYREDPQQNNVPLPLQKLANRRRGMILSPAGEETVEMEDAWEFAMLQRKSGMY